MSGYKDFGYNTEGWNHVHAYILKPLLNLLDSKKERIILDLGCGNGWLVNHLVELGYNAYGTDASVSGIEIAKRKNNERFFLQELGKDELPEAIQNIQFNTIISTEVIEHLYQPKEYLDFCKKILNQNGGGELMLTTPYHGYLKNVVLSLSGKMDKHFTVLWDGGHIKFWSRKTLTKLLEQKGFSSIEFAGCGRLPWLWKSMLLRAHI
ncbi:MAG TPA: class I SAM-dependent methyltransferase [Parafilimonas sp.]|nr:class I SAM-dependent methyltransferase [Parafilimonas sp.]